MAADAHSLLSALNRPPRPAPPLPLCPAVTICNPLRQSSARVTTASSSPDGRLAVQLARVGIQSQAVAGGGRAETNWSGRPKGSNHHGRQRLGRAQDRLPSLFAPPQTRIFRFLRLRRRRPNRRLARSRTSRAPCIDQPCRYPEVDGPGQPQ